jgi:hypothetical protein
VKTYYCGPEGYGASPELSFGQGPSHYRMQSMQPIKDGLTLSAKQKIMDTFAPFDADIVKIDKTRKGYVRIWYNNCTRLYKKER